MADDKTKEQLQAELDLRNAIESERDKNDKLFAKKIVESIVFGILVAFALAVISGLAEIFLKHFSK